MAGPCAGAVSEAGQIVVETGMTEVWYTVEGAWQDSCCAGQLVIVATEVAYTVDVVNPPVPTAPAAGLPTLWYGSGAALTVATGVKLPTPVFTGTGA